MLRWLSEYNTFEVMGLEETSEVPEVVNPDVYGSKVAGEGGRDLFILTNNADLGCGAPFVFILTSFERHARLLTALCGKLSILFVCLSIVF